MSIQHDKEPTYKHNYNPKVSNDAEPTPYGHEKQSFWHNRMFKVLGATGITLASGAATIVALTMGHSHSPETAPQTHPTATAPANPFAIDALDSVDNNTLTLEVNGTVVRGERQLVPEFAVGESDNPDQLQAINTAIKAIANVENTATTIPLSATAETLLENDAFEALIVQNPTDGSTNVGDLQTQIAAARAYNREHGTTVTAKILSGPTMELQTGSASDHTEETAALLTEEDDFTNTSGQIVKTDTHTENVQLDMEDGADKFALFYQH